MFKIIAAFCGLLFKVLLSILFYATPVLGFWLASSLAAYLGGPSWMAWTAGALLFPIIPGLWELHYHTHRSKIGKPLLTLFDRLSLRTFGIGLAFIVVLLCVYPQKAFVSLSTRGDWMLDGVKDPRADRARKVLFTAAGGLQWLYDATKNNPYRSLIDPKARQLAEQETKRREQEAKEAADLKAKQLDELLFHPIAQGSTSTQQGETDENGEKLDSLLFDPTKPNRDKKKPSLEGIAMDRPLRMWPWKQTTLHPVVANMPASVETSIKSVARYIADHEKDPYMRIKALHDYVADRVAYDAENYYAGRYPPQDAETVFRTHKSVCAGYSNLLSALATACNEKIVVVLGDARNETGDGLSPGGHAWNAACIKGNWYLIDATWDAGYITREKGFTKEYKTDYLLVPPNVMIADHFPDKATWQLLAHPLSQGEFLRGPMLRPSFQSANLALIDPNRAQNEAESAAVAIIKNPNHYWLMAALEENGRQIGSSKTYNSETTRVEFPLPDRGTYRLNMFINKGSEYGSYNFVGSLDFVRR